MVVPSVELVHRADVGARLVILDDVLALELADALGEMGAGGAMGDGAGATDVARLRRRGVAKAASRGRRDPRGLHARSFEEGPIVAERRGKARGLHGQALAAQLRVPRRRRGGPRRRRRGRGRDRIEGEVGLDQLELHQRGRAVEAADKVDAGVEQGLVDRREDRLGRRRARRRPARGARCWRPIRAGRGNRRPWALLDGVAERAVEPDERDLALALDRGQRAGSSRRAGRRRRAARPATSGSSARPRPRPAAWRSAGRCRRPAAASASSGFGEPVEVAGRHHRRAGRGERAR